MRVFVQWWVRGLAVLAACCSLGGAQLPLRRYTTPDGLVSNAVLGIASDSRGFLWFATGEGLSRFDGFDCPDDLTRGQMACSSFHRCATPAHRWVDPREGESMYPRPKAGWPGR